MEFLLDTANIPEIERCVASYPIAGVTSNPSILKKEGKIELFDHMKKIRSVIGPDKSLHVQVIADDYEGMLKDAEALISQIDKQVYIKIPTTEVGLKVMKELKRRGYHVTATAIYTKMQAYLATAIGVDYIAPYFNRMENLNIDSPEAIRQMVKEILRSERPTKVLAASFKNIRQVNASLEAGAHAATMGVDILTQTFAMPSINQAVVDFTNDWESIHGQGATIASLL